VKPTDCRVRLLPDAGVAGDEGVHAPVRGREGGNCSSTILKKAALELESPSQAERANGLQKKQKTSQKKNYIGSMTYVVFSLALALLIHNKQYLARLTTSIPCRLQ
jgi:hypothetical protein